MSSNYYRNQAWKIELSEEDKEITTRTVTNLENQLSEHTSACKKCDPKRKKYCEERKRLAKSLRVAKHILKTGYFNGYEQKREFGCDTSKEDESPNTVHGRKLFVDVPVEMRWLLRAFESMYSKDVWTELVRGEIIDHVGYLDRNYIGFMKGQTTSLRKKVRWWWGQMIWYYYRNSPTIHPKTCDREWKFEDLVECFIEILATRQAYEVIKILNRDVYMKGRDSDDEDFYLSFVARAENVHYHY